MPPLAALGDSFRSFFEAVEVFLTNLAAVSWGLLAAGLLLHAAYVTVRTRAWCNALRAAFPERSIRWREVWGAYAVGFGVNSIVPARAGEVARLYLARQSLPGSSYPALASSFLPEAVFDATLGRRSSPSALTQGVFPDLPDLTRLPGGSPGRPAIPSSRSSS